jgi:hypothetical protein
VPSADDCVQTFLFELTWEKKLDVAGRWVMGTAQQRVDVMVRRLESTGLLTLSRCGTPVWISLWISERPRGFAAR